MIVTGAGHCVLRRDETPTEDFVALNIDTDAELPLLPWLKTPKMKKFMGKQDQLAVVAAGRATTNAGLTARQLESRTGIYLAVGYIPFERAEVEALTENSAMDGTFSMQRFSVQGLEAVNPLLTFRCLPNMPAFHVSYNFSMQGPYYVSYPDVGQFYSALDQALTALREETIDAALVGAVADQNNFLVRHQLDRLGINPPGYDAAGFLCLERPESAAARNAAVRGVFVGAHSRYEAPDLLAQIPAHEETLTLNAAKYRIEGTGYLGPASLAVMLSSLLVSDTAGEIKHTVKTSNGIVASSLWQR